MRGSFPVLYFFFSCSLPIVVGDSRSESERNVEVVDVVNTFP